ncbi:MAG: mechanosensitive ion channel domain-containing protein [Thermoguttaceae bacterium]
MVHARSSYFRWTQLLLWLSVATAAFGQAAPPRPQTDAEFLASIRSWQTQINDLRDVADAEKDKIRKHYEQAVNEMEAAAQWATKTSQFEAQAASAPKKLEQIKADLSMPVQPAVEAPTEATLPQIEQAMSKGSANLERWRAALTEVETELKGRTVRRAQIPELLNTAKHQLEEIASQLQKPPANDEGVQSNSARRIASIAQQRNLRQQIACYEAELLAYEARTELLPLSHDLHARQVVAAEQELKQWQARVNDLRKQDAERQVQQASQEVRRAPRELQLLANKNKELADERKTLADRFAEVTRQLEHVNQWLALVTEMHKNMTTQVAVAGKNVTNQVGLSLRQQRDQLPNIRDLEGDIDRQQDRQREASLKLLDLQIERVANLDKQTEVKLQEWKVDSKSPDYFEMVAAIREALNTRKKEYLAPLMADYNTYYNTLVALTTAESQLIKVTEECLQFIDARVLWISSASPIGWTDFRNAGDAFWWLAGPPAWLDLGRTLTADASRNKTLTVLALCVFFLLFYLRMRLHARIQDDGQQASRANCCRLWPTLETTLLTFLVSSLWPGVMYYIAWRLASAPDASDLCRSLSEGVYSIARVYLALELLRYTCGVGGLGEAHFGWSAAATKLIRANIRWFITPALVLMCVAVTMAWQPRNEWDTSLGRLAFMTALVCFSFALYRILRPAGVVFQAMIANRRGGWMERFRYVWLPLCTQTPTALAILAVFGYHYTARQLMLRLILTAYVLVGGIVVRALLLRWTLINQRRLAIEQARQRRAAAQTANVAGEEAVRSELPTTNAPERDLATINAQTRRFIEYAVGVACALAIWCAWVDVMPALNSLNARVWSVQVTVAGEMNGEKVIGTSHEEIRDIRLGDLLLAVIVFATTVIAAKNIPGLLEMAALQHLPLDAGARYAVATVCRYVITLVGVLSGCEAMGLGWLKIQWLVAAMGLGLGFGLQEIFANFVSGLIILFERPVRVGDLVTIDNISGVVSRIRIRATTITDADRKELIIPNKEFITGQVLNWTLTDPINRVVVKVGVAYGSDTERVAQILRDIAKNHPHVLDDPAPEVLLESFGESSLNFVLRCFLPNLENRGTVIHQLHMTIDRMFREAGVEMPFPQQDIHVRSIDVAVPDLTPKPKASWSRKKAVKDKAA